MEWPIEIQLTQNITNFKKFIPIFETFDLWCTLLMALDTLFSVSPLSATDISDLPYRIVPVKVIKVRYVKSIE